ncbi:MAG: hypothetical protein ABIV93_13430 [Byssovorax sp.]
MNDYRADSIVASEIQAARGRDVHDERDERGVRDERDVRDDGVRGWITLAVVARAPPRSATQVELSAPTTAFFELAKRVLGDG